MAIGRLMLLHLATQFFKKRVLLNMPHPPKVTMSKHTQNETGEHGPFAKYGLLRTIIKIIYYQ